MPFVRTNSAINDQHVTASAYVSRVYASLMSLVKASLVVMDFQKSFHASKGEILKRTDLKRGGLIVEYMYNKTGLSLAKRVIIYTC